jgi:toxin ParE1/3/4
MPGMKRFEIVVSKEAGNDLEAIYRYIARVDGLRQADDIEDRLMAAILSLETSPLQGKPPPEMQKLGVAGFHEIQSSPWRIFYYVRQEMLGVVAVLDGRRNVAELLQRRLLQ